MRIKSLFNVFGWENPLGLESRMNIALHGLIWCDLTRDKSIPVCVMRDAILDCGHPQADEILGWVDRFLRIRKAIEVVIELAATMPEEESKTALETLQAERTILLRYHES